MARLRNVWLASALVLAASTMALASANDGIPDRESQRDSYPGPPDEPDNHPPPSPQPELKPDPKPDHPPSDRQ
jgi:hypothetical protein